MKVKFTLAALALIAAGCSNQELTEAVQEGQDSNARIVTLQATMPETTDQAPATRATYESDGKTVSGVVMKWESTDKLKLCFKHGGNYYYKDADIVPGSISTNGKMAMFTLIVPTEIPDEDTFDFYAVYQREHPNSYFPSGYFHPGTTNFEIVADEYCNVTLARRGDSGLGIINPMLLFSAKNTTKAGLGTLKLNFEHTGWIMALHLKNSTGSERDLPRSIEFRYPYESTTSFIWNGYTLTYNDVLMDVSTGTVTTSFSDWQKKQCVIFGINEYSDNPLLNGKLAAGAELVLYRWVVSTPQIEEMQTKFVRKNGIYFYTTNRLPARTVAKGKVYHVFLDWAANGGKLTKRDGTPLP